MASSRSCAKWLRAAAALLPLIALSVALIGCAARGSNPNEPPEVTPVSESALYLDAVRGLIGQGQYYAAIAHIQEGRRRYKDSAELRLLEADARRSLKQNKTSEALYLSVLRPQPNGPLAGKAHHGLGLLYATYDLNASLRELRVASRFKPTDATIRSDLGFALMQARRFSEARIELATAHELAPANVAARNNLLILLFAQGEAAAAQRLANAAQLDARLLAQLKAQAQSLAVARPRS